MVVDKKQKKIINALEVIDMALEEYDEGCGLAGSDIPDKFEDIQNFFNDICYPDLKFNRRNYNDSLCNEV